MAHPGLKDGPIYLDYNATTPVDPGVVDAMLPYLSTYFGNPSSAHAYAQVTRMAMATAREQVALLLGCIPEEIVFTSCGSESNALAIRGAALANRFHGNHIITQVTEHPAVINVCKSLARLHGFRITYLPVDKYGRIDPAELEAAIDEQTTLISIMYANNETGTIQPIAELADIARRHRVLLHTDASQAVGKVPVDIESLGVDFLTLTGHKLYAPKGIGALYVRRGLQLEPLLYGGGQESGVRAGTENVAFMVALGAAASQAREKLPSSKARLQQLRDRLQQKLEQRLPHATHLNGHPSDRLPNTLNISIDGVLGEEVLEATPGIASSTGSACHEGNTEPSAVLTAMGLSRERALGALRLTLGRWTTEKEVDAAAEQVAQSVQVLWSKRDS
ncbi:cysteine desulfurase family protein [Dictyobacter aurantiacus]|uniref:cysteine desulfurase n=1 Tax=Dictyobacter aurantiacus TaxID=1936993 RepID=A0A401Z7J4_9CHLR|nr:cysteine desulfurase family protein [Dictyobacter aurantiacus]GCE02837.1 cysteine desulfurase [Dictyobacter aurantiacus]